MPNPMRNEPFRLISSECEPDSTRLSNIFLSSQIGAKGVGTYKLIVQIATINPSFKICLLTTRRGMRKGLAPSPRHHVAPAIMRDTKKLASQRTDHRASYPLKPRHDNERI